MNVKLPIDPREMPDGVILALSVRYAPEEGDQANSTIYTYAAIKSGGFWYLTGGRTPQAAGWGAVERWLERDRRELVRVEIATGSCSIWPESAGAAIADQDDMMTRPIGADQ